MYKFLLPLLLVLMTFACNNQSSNKNYVHYVKVYQNAFRHGDVNVAINACYDISDPSFKNGFHF